MKRVIATKNMKGTDGYNEEHAMNHQGFTPAILRSKGLYRKHSLIIASLATTTRM
jgi:hypothetical protein